METSLVFVLNYQAAEIKVKARPGEKKPRAAGAR
jgi:hypothetical protein